MSMPTLPSLRCNFWLRFLSLVLSAGLPLLEAMPAVAQSWPERRSLDGDWEFRRDQDSDWKTVQLPAPFEHHEGTQFDGVGWYRKRLKQRLLTPHESLTIRFHGAATQVQVWCGGQIAGSHLGGWTPWDCDLTPWLRAETEETATEVELLVRVDELVGHNSQGFLPVFAPHFGGLWQSIELQRSGAWRIDDHALFAYGDVQKQAIGLQVPIRLAAEQSNPLPSAPVGVHVRYRKKPKPKPDAASNPLEAEPSPWHDLNGFLFDESEIETLVRDRKLQIDISIPIENPPLWSPESPDMFEVQVHLMRRILGPAAPTVITIDSASTTAAFRTITAQGERLLLNGQPLRVRGILNWGYAPPSTAPSLDPKRWREELELVKAYGFNLIKCCLWIPPKGFLEMADELGVLVWMEYPTWHAPWTADQLPKLQHEFDEFFLFDRPHPSVILRSLTCETGPSADLNVLKALYDQCHQRIPGSIVEDDSSWIQWNRVHDFYDDHPYGNNHTWVATLDRLKKHIAEHGSKPLVLGEAIAADTWLDPRTLDPIVGDARPFWLPGFFDANREWLENRRRDMGEEAIARLGTDSLDYALAMRKYQIEAYQREVPDGGYVVSVIRDFPFAGMGLLDFQGHPKWPASDWSWHGDSMLVLKTERDARSFEATTPFQAEWTWKAPPLRDLQAIQPTLHWYLEQPTGKRIERVEPIEFPTSPTENDAVHRSIPPQADMRGKLRAEWSEWLEFPDGDQPQTVALHAEVRDGDRVLARNRWKLWVMPPRSSEIRRWPLEFHPSCDDGFRARILEALGTSAASADASTDPHSDDRTIVIARRFDGPLLQRLQDGATVCMIPDGSEGSLPLQDHWFLRGGPVITSRHANWNALHDMLVELQHFDLASRIVPELQWLDQLDPLVMLWDNHDIARVKTHGLLFASQVGDGKLMVDAIHSEARAMESAAGRFLLHRILHTLKEPQPDPSQATLARMDTQTLEGMKNKLALKTLPLTQREWQFRIDTENRGLSLGWHQPEIEATEDWKPMQIGKHWESLGYPGLDGWAWYRISVELPTDWQKENLYLWLDGADDYIEIYANGEKIGSAGDIETKRTAFEDHVDFAIPARVSRAEGRIALAIRVYDWYGAGGLFRPIVLATTPRTKALEILR